MFASTALDKPALIEKGMKLLDTTVYSVVELEEFRRKAKDFRESAAKLLISQPSVPDVASPPQDLLDWVNNEKASIQVFQDALLLAGPNL